MVRKTASRSASIRLLAGRTKAFRDNARHARVRKQSNSFAGAAAGGRTDRRRQFHSLLRRNTTATWSIHKGRSAVRRWNRLPRAGPSLLENGAGEPHLLQRVAAVVGTDVDGTGTFDDDVNFETFTNRIQRCFADTVILRQSTDPDALDTGAAKTSGKVCAAE